MLTKVQVQSIIDTLTWSFNRRPTQHEVIAMCVNQYKHKRMTQDAFQVLQNLPHSIQGTN